VKTLRSFVRVAIFTAIIAAIAICCARATQPLADHSALAGNVTAKRVLEQTDTSPDWLVPGRDFNEQHFSPLKQINDQNVKSLGLAWYLPIDSAMGMSSEPIEVDGTVYVTAPLDIVYAVDASSGKLLWRFDPEVERGVSTQNSYAVRVNRGAAVWEGAVYVATGDCRLFAIDAASGKKLWSSQVCDPAWTGSTGAPHVAGGKVFITYNGSDDETRLCLSKTSKRLSGRELYFFHNSLLRCPFL
jgi:glucose dehydrogenase